jgi:cobalamin biosynthesis Mg chelatase CobN
MRRVRRSSLGIGPVLVAGLLLFAGCQSSKVDDDAVTTHIQAKLFDDSVLKTRDVHVKSENGAVRLSGTVATDLEKAAVERIASQTDGVRTVDSQLVVSSTASADSAATVPQAQAAKSTPPESPVSTASRPEHARRSGRRHPAASASSGDATADPASGQEGPTSDSLSMMAQAAPPAPVPAAPAAAPPAPAPPSPVVKPPEQLTIPSGTLFSVRLIDGIDSTQSRAGDEFAATIDAPVMVGDRVAIPHGSDARVRLVQATNAGRMSGRSDLKIELVSVSAGGQKYELQTAYYEQAGASRSTRTAETVGGGAVLGALIGAIAGRGRGAAIGSVAGAGTGTAVEAGTHGQPVKLHSESKLSFSLKSPLTVTLNPPAS